MMRRCAGSSTVSVLTLFNAVFFNAQAVGQQILSHKIADKQSDKCTHWQNPLNVYQ